MGKMKWSIVSPAENKDMIWLGERERTLSYAVKLWRKSGYRYKAGEKGIARLPVALLP